MEKLEEKLESLEQVIEAMISKFGEMEMLLGTLAAVEPLDFSPLVIKLNEIAAKSNRPDLQSRILESLGHLHDKVVRTPSEVRHHHHLELRTRSRLWWLAAIFLLVSGSCGTAVSVLLRNNELYAGYERYRAVRAFYPKTAEEVDRIYRTNRMQLMKGVDSILAQPAIQKPSKKRKI